MKRLSTILLFLFAALIVNAQSKKIDTLRLALSKATEPDTVRLNILHELARNYFTSKPDSALLFAQEYYGLAGKFKRVKDQASALNNMANAYITLGDYVKGFSMYFKAIKLNESINELPGIVVEYSNLGNAYTVKQEYSKALPYLRAGLKIWLPYAQTHKITQYNQREQTSLLFLNTSEVFLYTHQIDSAEHYLQLSYADSKKNNFGDLLGNIERDLGEVEAARDHKTEALKYFRHSLPYSVANEDAEMLSVTYLSMANLYHKYKQQDSAEYYAQKALEAASTQRYLQDVYNAGKVLYAYYEEDNNLPQAYKYLKITTTTKDSLFSQDKVKQLLSMDFDEKQRQRELQITQAEAQNRLRTYILSGGLGVLLLLAFVFWRNSRQKQKANAVLAKTLSDLKATQTQLVQSEKMASLGELTAGIAHEIQNPLNFVNNFSELNTELLVELKQEISAKNYNEVVAIADNVIGNEQKINIHGKRADAIVKGMLQHSQSGTGKKEPTDISALADECMRVAYHGLRAKNKSFSAELITHFDPDLPEINVIPQDMGRILLNLFNNAFYAVYQKVKATSADYTPQVTVTTSSAGGQFIVNVKDNGNGIPDSIKDKIMQPFFTTKPTGEGTGLGLSLTYDMVVKGHGGRIEVNSIEGEGSEFIISLPIN